MGGGGSGSGGSGGGGGGGFPSSCSPPTKPPAPVCTPPIGVKGPPDDFPAEWCPDNAEHYFCGCASAAFPLDWKGYQRCVNKAGVEGHTEAGLATSFESTFPKNPLVYAELVYWDVTPEEAVEYVNSNYGDYKARTHSDPGVRAFFGGNQCPSRRMAKEHLDGCQTGVAAMRGCMMGKLAECGAAPNHERIDFINGTGAYDGSYACGVFNDWVCKRKWEDPKAKPYLDDLEAKLKALGWR